MITLYGIKNCDTMKKAFRWLDENHIEYQFIDYKKVGLDKALAEQWLNKLGWGSIINKRGTTWRKLDDNKKETMNNATALETIIEQPSMIKRPLLIKDNDIILGFSAAQYHDRLLN